MNENVLENEYQHDDDYKSRYEFVKNTLTSLADELK